jgi:hypothetical protein
VGRALLLLLPRLRAAFFALLELPTSRWSILWIVVRRTHGTWEEPPPSLSTAPAGRSEPRVLSVLCGVYTVREEGEGGGRASWGPSGRDCRGRGRARRLEGEGSAQRSAERAVLLLGAQLEGLSFGLGQRRWPPRDARRRTGPAPAACRPTPDACPTPAPACACDEQGASNVRSTLR